MTAFSSGVLKTGIAEHQAAMLGRNWLGVLSFRHTDVSNFRLGFEEIGHHFLVITCSIDGVNFKESTENTPQSLTYIIILDSTFMTTPPLILHAIYCAKRALLMSLPTDLNPNQ